MTETRATYDVGGGKPSAAEFRQRPCCLPYGDPRYIHPTPQDFRDLVALTGWSQATLANLVGVGYSVKSGSTTVRKWKAEPGKKDAREIPYAAWRLLLIAAGIVTVEEDRAAVSIENTINS